MPYTPPNRVALGEVVRAARQDRSLSIEALAHAAGMHPTYLSGIERGHYNPSWDKLGSLAEQLDIPISELARRAEGA